MAVPGRRAQDARLVQARVWAAEARGAARLSVGESEPVLRQIPTMAFLLSKRSVFLLGFQNPSSQFSGITK